MKERKGTKQEILDHPYLADGYGYGGRQCLGRYFGDLVVETFVSHLVRGYYFLLLLLLLLLFYCCFIVVLIFGLFCFVLFCF